MKIIFFSISAFLILTQKVAPAQGTIYLSNLGQASIGSVAVGNNSWYASLFTTGHNAAGYQLNSVQLGMNDASGNPGAISVMIYSTELGGLYPETSLATLDGPINPSVSGSYTYTPENNFTLLSSTEYFIVVTSASPVASGAYDWSLAASDSYNPSPGWGYSAGLWASSDGSSWNSGTAMFTQFAINATPAPEPSTWAIILLGGGVLVYGRRAPSYAGKD